MEEEKHQKAAMEFKQLSFNGDKNNESNYIHVSSQQTPQNYVEFLSQTELSETYNQMVYNGEGVAVNNLTCLEQKSNDLKFRSAKATAAVGCSSRLRSNMSKQKAREADKRRRSMISERLDALQELLPHSRQGGRASAVSDVIDYIKYLQFQVKELSKSRLGGESIPTPFIFLEGYGHYLVQEHVVNESLEEMIAKLIKEDPSAAIQLLQSKGLFVMPMALAEGLSQGI